MKPKKELVPPGWKGVKWHYKKYLKWYIIIGIFCAIFGPAQLGMIQRSANFIIILMIGLIIHGINGYFSLTQKYPLLLLVIAFILMLPAFLKRGYRNHRPSDTRTEIKEKVRIADTIIRSSKLIEK